MSFAEGRVLGLSWYLIRTCPACRRIYFPGFGEGPSRLSTSAAIALENDLLRILWLRTIMRNILGLAQ